MMEKGIGRPYRTSRLILDFFMPNEQALIAKTKNHKEERT